MNIENVSCVLLTGDESDYISLKLAVECAEQGFDVWYISFQQIESLPQGINKPCREVLQLITFIYLNNYQDLLKHLNGIHKWKKLPQVVILKDFEKYCNLAGAAYDSTKAALICATLLDSLSYLSKKNNCFIRGLVSCTNLDEENVSKLQVLYDMYFDNCLLRKDYQDKERALNTIKGCLNI